MSDPVCPIEELVCTLGAQYQADAAARWVKSEEATAILLAMYRARMARLLQPILAHHAVECGCTEWNGTEIVFPPEEEAR